jgi:hypothetical protein
LDASELDLGANSFTAYFNMSKHLAVALLEETYYFTIVCPGVNQKPVDPYMKGRLNVEGVVKIYRDKLSEMKTLAAVPPTAGPPLDRTQITNIIK